MPVYNRPDLLGRAIDSILNQTVTDFEFIIVDDGSDLETKKVLKEYAAKDDRIRLVYNAKNRGIAFSRQRGIELARGTYIATMDSDDWSVPDRLEKSLNFMKDYPHVDALTGRIASIPKDTFLPTYQINSDKKYTVNKLPGFYEVELTFYNSFPNVASFFKRSFVEENQIRYNPGLESAEDYDFWRQFVLFNANLASISDLLVYVRSHSTNASTYYKAMHDNSLEIHRKMMSHFFVPTEEDLKFSYSVPEKCLFLSQMLKANLKNPQIPHIYLEDRFNAQCPINYKDSFYLTHQYWSDFLVPQKNNRWKRHATDDTATITVEKDKIIVLWDKWAAETFYLQKDKSYQYMPSGSKEQFKHIYWQDDIIIPSDLNQKTCRFSNPKDWASVHKIDKDTIIITWDKSEWGSEKFRKNKEGVWEFVSKVSSSDTSD